MSVVAEEGGLLWMIQRPLEGGFGLQNAFEGDCVVVVVLGRTTRVVGVKGCEV